MKHTPIILFALVLCACVDFDPGMSPPRSHFDVGGTAAMTVDVRESTLTLPCSTSCYEVIGFNAYIPGSVITAPLPALTLNVGINGVALGATTPRSEPLLYYPPPTDLYRITWDEPVGAADLHALDTIEVRVTAAPDDHLVNACAFRLTQLQLDNGNVGCVGTGQIEIHFAAQGTP